MRFLTDQDVYSTTVRFLSGPFTSPGHATNDLSLERPWEGA
jgi:hypothetical protein